MGTGICHSEISECANQFSHSVCLVYLGTPKLVGKHLLSHKHRCILLDFWRRDIWTMRDQRSASTALLPASWSNLWFWVKSNWAWPQHRPAQEYKLMDQRPLQEQTKPEQHPKWEKKKKKKRWEAWESRDTCTFCLLATTEQHCSVILDTVSSKW